MDGALRPSGCRKQQAETQQAAPLWSRTSNDVNISLFLSYVFFRFSSYVHNSVPSFHSHVPAQAQVKQSSEPTTPASYLSHISPLCDWASAGRGLHLCVMISCILNWQPFRHRGRSRGEGQWLSAHFTAVDGSRKSRREKCSFHDSHQQHRTSRCCAAAIGGISSLSRQHSFKKKKRKIEMGETQSPMLGKYC